MPLDLSGCYAKIERAKKHIGEFNREKIAFLESNPYAVVTKFDPESNITESILGVMPGLPTHLSTTVGDAIQNLRSALDYLVAELARKNGNDPKLVYFPISETAEKYVSESKGKTKGISLEVKEFIDSIEPYGGGDGNDLWILHTLNNADKHRLLMPIAVNLAHEVVFSLSPEGNTFTTMVDSPGLNQGDVLGSVSGNSEGQQRIQFTFDVAFGKPDSISGEPVLRTLEYLGYMVETIVGTFNAKF
jgi:hypothetical protein